MSSYHKIIAFVIILFLSGCSTKTYLTQKHIEHFNNDTLMLAAIDSEMNNKHNLALEFYSQLYALDNLDNFEEKVFNLSIATQEYTQALNIIQNRLKTEPDNLDYQEQYVKILIAKHDYENALLIQTNYIKQEPTASRYELLAAIYFQMLEYTKSLDALMNGYNISRDVVIAVKIIDMYELYLDDIPKAIEFASSHQKFVGFDEVIAKRIINIYINQQNFAQIVESYFELYQKTKKISYAKKLVDIYIFRKEYDKAIEFLESYNTDMPMLFELYKSQKEIKKAYDLANKLYQTTNDIDYLAQSGILEYENATDKSKVVADVRAKLTPAVKQLDNPTYLNYLGYLLIEHDIDIKEGMEYVNQALKSDPNSPYYLDSLAWGYYKLRDYSNAYKFMKIVVDLIGDNNEEVKEHWKVIKNIEQKD